MWMGGIEPMKASYGKLMMWFFLISDTFTFSALLVSYGMVRFSYPAYEGTVADFTFSNLYWPIPEKVYEAVPFLHGVELPLVFVGIMTFILIFSSVTMVLAVEAGHRMDRAAVEKYMLWTLLGGITFLSCQAWEWAHFIHGTDTGTVVREIGNGTWVERTIFGANLIENQYGPPAFADFFFFITGFHGTHVFSGVVLNFLIFYRSATGFYDRRGHYEMVEKVGLYWHFVDLVWVFVFTFFYLV
jgi:cytochrome c oxidase subunit 3